MAVRKPATKKADTKPPAKSANQAKARELMAEVNKILGDDALRMGGDPFFQLSYIPTGVLPIDILLGGGFARGRITELYGDWSTLKTFVGLRAIATVQQAGGLAALIDTEHSYDPEWAEMCGVDPKQLVMKRPDNGEQAIDVTEALIRSRKVDLILWDSVAATLPKTEEEKGSEEKVQPGRLAALMSAGLRKINTANQNTALVFTNQTRMSIGNAYVPETTPGGKALPFYASVRLNLRKAGRDIENITVRGKKVRMVNGINIRAGLEKSKVSAPHRDALFTFDFRIPGIDDAVFLVDHGLEYGYVKQKGQKFTALGRNSTEVTYRKAMAQQIRDDPQLHADMVAAAWATVKP